MIQNKIVLIKHVVKINLANKTHRTKETEI